MAEREKDLAARKERGRTKEEDAAAMETAVRPLERVRLP